MKKKSMFILLLVVMVGLFMPRGVFAKELKYITGVDYRFFVEDQDEKDVDNLKFRLHDVNNVISYESEYDPNTKAYYFIDMPSTNLYQSYEEYLASFDPINSKLLPDGFVNDLNNSSFFNSPVYYYTQDWNEQITQLASKYSSVDAASFPMSDSNYNVFGYQLNLKIYVPFILDEVGNTSDNSIKKVIFGVFDMIPVSYDYNNELLYLFQFVLINNTCTYKNSNMTEEYFQNYVYPVIQLSRNNAYDYTDGLIQKYTSGNFASTEINSNNYLNRGFNNERFSTGEVPGMDSGEVYGKAFTDYFVEGTSNKVSSEPKVQLLRSSDDNIPENILKDYCDCLPVFVQQRKAKNIVQVLTNPKTWNGGIVVLGISLIVVVGTSIVVISRKKSNSKV